jgi:PAS domain S-box-containing protein
MWKALNKGRRASVLYAAITFVVLLVITQLLVYQRYSSVRKNEFNELMNELDDTRDQLGVILDHNLSSATTVSILYKQSRTLTWFDSVAKELLAMNKAIDVVYFVDKDLVVTHVYPLQGNETVRGFNLLSDPYRRAEAKLALSQDKIVFGGPYDMLQEKGKAISGRLPLFEAGKFIGGSVVVTKLSTIRKRMPELENKGKEFVYQLSKVNVLTGKREYFFDGYRPQKNWETSIYMPRGNWILYVAYADGFIAHKTIILLSIFGLLFSAMGAVFIYFKTYAKLHLEATVTEKTHDLCERMKELSTIYEINEILKDERQSTDIAFSRVVKAMPPGWQYPDICAARIVVGDDEYKTDNCADTKYKMRAPLNFMDERAGYIEVGYVTDRSPGGKDPFLKEEQQLLNSIAESIEVYYNKKFSRDRMARSEATLRSMVEACPVGVLLCDKDFRIVAINSTMAADYPVNTGRNIGVGDNFIEVLLPERREYVTGVFKAVMDDLEQVEYEVAYPKGEENVYFNINVAPVVINGEAIGVCLVGVDITSRKRLQLEHQRIIRDLMEHMSTAVEFARVLTDKVREPLEKIPLQADRAKDEKNDEQRAVLLDDIKQSAEYVTGFIRDMQEALMEKKG